MSLSITLYAGCKLSKKYNQVFKDLTTMETYLGTVGKKTVYTGDDIYYTNSGTISIENSSLLGHLGDKYNYMQFTHTTEGGVITKRFAFVNNITLVNEVAVIEYEEDIWHTYAIKSDNHNINLFNSLLGQAKTLIGGIGFEYTSLQLASLPKALPIQPEGQNAPNFFSPSDAYPYDTQVYVLLTASMFKLTAQGEVNQRWVSNYLLSYKDKVTGSYTPSSLVQTDVWDIDNQLLTVLATVKAMSSDTQVRNKVADDPNWHYEIIDCKIIPASIGNSFFSAVLGPDSTHDSGLHSDFDVDTKRVALCNDGTYHVVDTNISFNNVVLNEEFKYVSGTETRYTYNGIPVNARVQHTKTIIPAKNRVAIGNMSRIIPITYNGLNKTAIFELVVNLYDNKIQLFFDNTITDMSSDFTLEIPLSVQSADITQQQKIARFTQNMTGLIGMAQQTIGGVSSIMNQGAVGNQRVAEAQGAGVSSAGASAGFSMGATALNTMYGLLGSSIPLQSRNQAQYITNKIINTDETAIINCILNGLRDIEMNYDNGLLLDDMIAKYGYIYRLIINEFNTVYTANNYIRFEQANVYGEFSQEIARGLESILENGTILL